MNRKKIAVAPLDWGLGHATRCIPIIKYLLEKKIEVIIICTGRSLLLLKKEFPELVFIDLPAYNISYQKKGSFIFKITKQLNKVFSGIKKEHNELKKIIAAQHIDLIISDNRYGLYNKKVKSILISHQMMVKMPASSLVEYFIHAWLMRQHNHFDEVWIPDVAGKPNVAIDLSHRYKLKTNTKFIGVLTRFEKPLTVSQIRNDVLIILSGPEPQRSIFEELLLTQIKKMHAEGEKLKFVLVRGTSEINSDEKYSDKLRVISHLPANALYSIILQSEIILSRGGYSTLMDICCLNKKCILVPTPGQTEQEYLVEQLHHQNLVYASPQKNFNLKVALTEVNKTNGFFIDVDTNAFKLCIDATLEN